jgi:hypothetical protein
MFASRRRRGHQRSLNEGLSNMLIQPIALISESAQVAPDELMRVAAALQKQATRDLAPIWGIAATVDAFESLETMPIGYWPIVIRDGVRGSATGYHRFEKNKQPFAVVGYWDGWSRTASHECLEMLVDPFGCRLVVADAIQAPSRRVLYLLEICDPCDGRGYYVNDVAVSDFHTPEYLTPSTHPRSGTLYSYDGSLTAPREIQVGGYISWIDPVEGMFWQLHCVGRGAFNLVGPQEVPSAEGTLRHFSDGLASRVRVDIDARRAAGEEVGGELPLIPSIVPESHDFLTHHPHAFGDEERARRRSGGRLRAEIERLLDA